MITRTLLLYIISGALASAPVAEVAPATGAGANRGFIVGSLKPQRDLSGFPIGAAYCQAVVLIGFARLYTYKAYRKYGYWHYVEKQQRVKQM